MAEAPIDPENCRSMTDVRAGVDDLDAAIVHLLARRFAYMRAAARIKPVRTDVRDEPRKAQVIANARSMAVELGIPADVVTDIWERLVEGSIAYELAAWDGRREN